MGWSSGFKTSLAGSRLSILYYVDTISIFGPLGAVDTPGGAGGLSTIGQPVITGGRLRGIDPLSVQCGTEALDLRTCTYSGGEFRFDFIWSSAADRSSFYDAFTRGTPLRLSLGFAGDAPADAETLKLGVIADIVEQGRRISVRCWDLLSVLHPRIVKDTWPILFSSVTDAGTTAIDTTGYTAGDATIYVTDASIFEQEDGAAYYVARVTPDTGDPFYVKFTGVDTGATPNELTGVTASGQYGTTAADASVNNLVEPVALVEGTPFEIAQKVLASTGAFGGGIDTLPASWGYGIDTNHIDDSDMTVWESVVAPGSGSHLWSWLATAGDENGLGTLTAWLALGGMWLCMRQGQITARALQDLWSSPTATGDTITERNIMLLEASLEPRDAGQPFEYTKVKHAYLSGSTVTYHTATRSTNATWPLDEIVAADLTSVIYSNGSAITTNYGDRMKPWYTQIPERLKVRLSGLTWMRYAVGDVVSITSTALRGFLVNTEDGPSAQPYMIAAIRWGLPAPFVDLDLVLTPEDTTDERL